MSITKDTEGAQYHIFAWQGISFAVPENWNLAEYQIGGGNSYARFHDDYNRRLDFEWVYARQPLKPENIRRRYAKVAESMAKALAAAENLEEMPAGWSACLYSMPETKYLAAAFYLSPDNRFFGLIKIYFDRASRREPVRIVRQIALTFKLHEQGLVPWTVYDVDFELQRDFKLVATSFQAGRKLFIFEWRARRLYLWFFSLSDILLAQQPMEKWCAEYLNGFKAIAGVRFAPGQNGAILAERRWRRFYGKAEPILRGCLHNRAWCRRIPEKNQLLLMAYNYRRETDLAFLESALGPSLRFPAFKAESA